MEPRRHVSEFHKIVKIVNGGVSATLINVVHKRRAVGGHQYRAVATNGDAAGGVAGVLNVFSGCACLDDGAAQPRGKPDSGAIDVGARLAKQIKHLWIVEKINADLRQ